jgi:hypothetical protein
MSRIKVFISYAHEDDAHRARVANLAQTLRSDGLECFIDQFINGSPPGGWPLWMEQQIERSDFVLIVGSRKYLERYQLKGIQNQGLGAKWEGAIVRSELYFAAGYNTKFIPVIFDGTTIDTIPTLLRVHNYYHLPADYEKLLRVLTAQAPITPVPIGELRVFPSATYSTFDFKAHRSALEARAQSNDWWGHAIPLDVTSAAAADGGVEARKVLLDWLDSAAHQHCIVLGDPGAGKTGLLWWVASVLARRDVVPVFVSATKLRPLHQIAFADLGKIADPALNLVTPLELDGRQFFLLLDGLDELVGAEVGGDKTALELLRKVFKVLPPSSRIIAACRTPAFAAIDREFTGTLPNNSSASNPADPYDRAITQALGLSNENPLILRVKPVTQNRAGNFLRSKAVDGGLIRAATTSSKFIPFLSSPFSLRLLTLALPRLIRKEEIAIDDLYRIYVHAALSRENPSLTTGELEEIVTEFRESVFTPARTMTPRFQNIAYSAGLISKRKGRLEFSHYSLWEYFFASGIFDQISKYDSKILARLDLVSGYNINRMLVPMILRMLAHETGASVARVRPVSAPEYRSFLDTSGWRKRTGYGVHPSIVKSADGTPSATFAVDPETTWSIHRDHRHGSDVACAISWYDAAVFAMHAGTRIPTSTEIVQMDLNENYLFWCADWHTEEIAHICVYEAATGEIHGMNPDVRLQRTALAVLG